MRVAFARENRDGQARIETQALQQRAPTPLLACLSMIFAVSSPICRPLIVMPPRRLGRAMPN